MRSLSSNLVLALAGIIAAGNTSYADVNLRFPFNTLITSLNFTDNGNSTGDNSTVTNPATNSTTFIPKQYIVELDGTPGTTDAANKQAAFLATANQQLNFTVRRSYNSLINGVSIEFQGGDEKNAHKLANISDVKTAKPFVDAEGHAPIVHATGADAARLRRRQSSGIDPNAGSGIKVGIVDSGIDYLHPALGGCFGAGCKVAYGHDFVGDDFTNAVWPAPGWKPVEDDDPLDTCNGHGTHVAGLIAGNAADFKGFAPAATLGAYRVLSCTGSTPVDIIVAALLRAASDGMDVINISIGSGRSFNYPDADVAQYLVQKGITVIASAGNDGYGVLNSVNSPGIAPGVISVGSRASTNYTTFYFTDIATGANYGYVSSNNSVVTLGNTRIALVEQTNKYACSTLTKKYTSQFVLVERGACDFTTKAQNVKKAGGSGMLIMNEELDYFTAVVDPGPNIPVVTMEANAAGQLATAINSTSVGYITAKWQPGRIGTPYVFAGFMARYTSVGPSLDFNNIKPDISQYGDSVYSTYPRALGSYALLTGTSMAAPQVAGMAAAALQSLGSTISKAERPAAVRRVVKQRSYPHIIAPADQNNGTAVFWPPFILGQGVAQPIVPSEPNWGLSPESISYIGALTGGAGSTRSFKITLTGNIPPGTMRFIGAQYPAFSTWAKNISSGLTSDLTPGGLTVSPSTISISSQTGVTNINTLRSETITVTLTLPVVDTSNSFWVAGYAFVAMHTDAATGVSTIRHIPIQASLGTQNAIPILHRETTTYPRLDSSDAGYNILPSNSSNRIIDDKGNFVAGRFRFVEPTPWLIVTVEDTAGKTLGLSTDIYSGPSIGGPMERTKADPNDDVWSAWHGLINPVISFNNYDDSTILAVPDGKYRLRVYAARSFMSGNDLNDPKNYDTWLSPDITVKGIAAQFQASGGAAAQSNSGALGASARISGKLRAVLPRANQVRVDLNRQAATALLMKKYRS